MNLAAPSPRLLTDLILVLCGACRACVESKVMLARVRPSGAFELLSAAAWARALGYSPGELKGKSLRALMELEAPDAGELVAALFDETDARPIDVTLRCKDERRTRVRLHRRFDSHEAAVFIVADLR